MGFLFLEWLSQASITELTFLAKNVYNKKKSCKKYINLDKGTTNDWLEKLNKD